MAMSETQWYGSKRHFETEMSYEEYKEELKEKLKKKKQNPFRIPTLKELMRM